MTRLGIGSCQSLHSLCHTLPQPGRPTADRVTIYCGYALTTNQTLWSTPDALCLHPPITRPQHPNRRKTLFPSPLPFYALLPRDQPDIVSSCTSAWPSSLPCTTVGMLFKHSCISPLAALHTQHMQPMQPHTLTSHPTSSLANCHLEDLVDGAMLNPMHITPNFRGASRVHYTLFGL